jgi:CubicO group peptidase (beta-lactamase class C family)
MAGVSTIVVLAMALGPSAAAEQAPVPLVPSADRLQKELASIVKRRRVPALAAALVTSDGPAVRAMAGVVVEGDPRGVDDGSRFHIGSVTKTMTSLLIAMLVSEGRLRWDMTLAEALPDVAMREEYRGVTLRDLLLNRAGIIAFQDTRREDPSVVADLWTGIPKAAPAAVDQRRAVAERVLALPPIAAPGTRSVYSNVGWAIAGHIAERAAGVPWEELCAVRIFAPLGMAGSRIGGWPASAADPLQPRGHYPPSWFLGRPRPQALEDPYTFPAWMNPAGGVSCTLDDFARYAREYLLGAQGRGALLDAAGYASILSVQGEAAMSEMYPGSPQSTVLRFGLPWGVSETRLGAGWYADGTGGTFYARIALVPAKGIAFVGLSNAGNGESAISDAMTFLTGLQAGAE